LAWARVKILHRRTNTDPGLPHPTGNEPNRHVHYIVIDKEDHMLYAWFFTIYTHANRLCVNEISSPYLH